MVLTFIAYCLSVITCFFLGIPNFKIPPLDPFSVREMLLNKTTDAVDLKAVMTQLYLTGVSNVQFSKLK